MGPIKDLFPKKYLEWHTWKNNKHVWGVDRYPKAILREHVVDTSLSSVFVIYFLLSSTSTFLVWGKYVILLWATWEVWKIWRELSMLWNHHHHLWRELKRARTQQPACMDGDGRTGQEDEASKCKVDVYQCVEFSHNNNTKNHPLLFFLLL